jgi:hypothetical protein
MDEGFIALLLIVPFFFEEILGAIIYGIAAFVQLVKRNPATTGVSLILGSGTILAVAAYLTILR